MKEKLLVLVIYLVIIVAVVFLSKVIIEAIIQSDMPDWLKILLLRS